MKKETKHLFIKGIIFQERGDLPIENKGIDGTTQDKLYYFFLFSGVLNCLDIKKGLFSGSIRNGLGISSIRNFFLEGTLVNFEQKFLGRPTISYSLKKDDASSWYLGTYSGKDSGKGTVKMVITPIDNSFFLP